ncbi:MAG: hypothetical protein GXY70_01475 [Euryarchaeota archaeon]|nr:hypothetical protein [Euryarchaeota archaeon]
MASKRRLEVPVDHDDHPDDKAISDVRSDRDIAIEGTWKEWFLRVFLKYCYAVMVLSLTCLVPLEMLRQLEGDMGLGAAFLSVLLILPLGLLGFIKLWGNGGLWGVDAVEDDRRGFL